VSLPECADSSGEHRCAGVRGIRNAWVRGSIPRGGSILEPSNSEGCSHSGRVQEAHCREARRRAACRPRCEPFRRRLKQVSQGSRAEAGKQLGILAVDDERKRADIGFSSVPAMGRIRRHRCRPPRAILRRPAHPDRSRDGDSRRAVLRPIATMDFTEARRALDEHLLLTLRVAREARARVRSAGSLLFITGTSARRPGVGLTIAAIAAAVLVAITANLALELAPIRINLIAAGFVDTPLSATLLGDELEHRRDQLRSTLPIKPVVTADDVAALAVHTMTNSALTGATYDVDGGEQVVPR
jgi:NAD(P)-dependent dehydrogenase (short-subunit alcohol dehydrogenase family)